jgi:citrate lyase subunit beta/citryl-CoA lyase
VRINRPWRLSVRDLEAVVGPNVRGLVLPKLESAAHITAIAEIVDELEQQRGMPPGHTLFFARIENPVGLLNAPEIARAHPRVVSVGLGSTDFTIAAGIAAGGAGNAMASFQVVVAARAAGRIPLGLVSVITDWSDLDAFRQVALESRAIGLRGAPCVHPSQVEILNEAFSPTEDELERAHRIVEGYELALADGIGATTIDGEFVDIPIYEQAKELLSSTEAT